MSKIIYLPVEHPGGVKDVRNNSLYDHYITNWLDRKAPGSGINFEGGAFKLGDYYFSANSSIFGVISRSNARREGIPFVNQM